MVGGGKIVGLGLMIGSVVIFIAFAAWAGTCADERRRPHQVAWCLDLVLALVVLTPIFGVGVYLFRSGTAEQGQYAVVAQERRILNIVLTQGQVTIGELVAELQQPRDAIEEMIRDLVGKQLFSGAINWEKGILV